MSNIKLYIINYTVPQYNKIGIASVTAISAQKAQSILQATGKYNAYKYNMSYPVLVHTTDTFTAESIITELDNPAGEKGDRGPQGPKGDKGDKGDPGDPMTWEKMDPEDKMTFKADAVADVESEIKTKYYPNMSVGMADNLVGRGDVQNAQINFRPSAGVDNITDGAARIERIKGNSVVYNQLAQNADFRNGVDRWVASGTSNISIDSGHIVFEATTSNASQQMYQIVEQSIPANHKILFLCDNQRRTTETVAFYAYLQRKSDSGFDTYIEPAYSSTERKTTAGIITTTGEINRIMVYPIIKATAGEKVDIYSIRLIDLTQMFGAEVANNITSYEAYLLLKPMNIEDEYAYTETPYIVDMKVDSLVSVGDNAWDEEWENGSFNTTTGTNISTASANVQIRSKNLIKVLPNTNYTCTIPAKIGQDAIWCMLLDKNKEVITGYTVPNAGISGNSFGLKIYAPSFTTPANAAYLKFYCSAIYGNVYTNDICFHLEQSGYKNGKYYPYQKVSKDLSWINEIKDSEGDLLFPNGMRSAGSAFDEIRYNPTKKVWEAVKRIGEVDLGSLSWQYKENYQCFNSVENFFVPMGNGLASKYSTRNVAASALSDKQMSFHSSFGTGKVLIKDLGYTDAQTFKTELQGVILNYELAKPIVVELDYPTAETNMDYLVWDFGTEEAIASVPSAPFRADINYEPNAVDDLRWAVSEIRNLKKQLAQMQSAQVNETSLIE